MLSIFSQIVFLLLFIFFFIFFILQFYNMIFRGYAPFISTRGKILDKILSELKIKEDATVYELGCGQAGFLRALRKKYPKAQLIGVEYQLLPYIIGKTQSGLSNSKIKFIKKDIFKVNLKQADLIYCYLNPGTMAKLENKFKDEAKSGAQIISYQFPLPNTQTNNTISIDKHNKIYFYKI